MLGVTNKLFMLSVIMLSVIMLSVVELQKQTGNEAWFYVNFGPK